MIQNDPILWIDGYKLGHRVQYPGKTQIVACNLTARSSRVEGVSSVVAAGLQPFIRKVLMDEFQTNFFDRPIDEVADQYLEGVNNYLGPNNGVGNEHIRALHALGYLPLTFMAWPEGSHVPIGMPLFLVWNTHEDFFWLPNYIETMLSAELWGVVTSATTAYNFRLMMNKWAKETGGDLDFVNWQGHDFSMRGMFGVEAAKLSGMGHLLSFWGTDTYPAIGAANYYYPGSPETDVIGGSVAATEHSVMCAGGKESELETFERLIDTYPGDDPEGFQILSVVSDTWDLWNVLTEIVPSLKDKILARNGKLVIRPDSGDPVKILCGDPEADPTTPAYKGVVELLWDEFGGTETETGHRLLDSHIGVIYGDGISPDRCNRICEGLARKGFASTNVVFGLGSYTYQYVTRDTYGMAMKATWVQIDGVGQSIFKRPVTDDGGKFSATGLLAVIEDRDETTGYRLVQNANDEDLQNSVLKPVWVNGNFVREYSLREVRDRVGAGA